MDQESFRSLLAAPVRPGTGRSGVVLGAPAPKRGHGGTSKFTKVDLAPKKDEKTALVPRKAKKDGKYKDRAEMRRLGLDDEYKPVEQLLQDFERRAHEGGEDAAAIEEQRRYLGGDAEHSILVKGLDYSLLAARKAEMEAQNANQYDDELDNLLIGGSGSGGGGGGGGGGDGGMEKGSRKGKEKERPKTRDEIVAELKRKRMEVDGDGDRDDIMGVVKKRKSVVQEPKAVALPSKFKSIAKVEQPVDTKIKKKKRKIKTTIEEVGVKQATAPSAADPTSSVAVQAEEMPVKPQQEIGLETKTTLESRPALPPSPLAVALTAPESDDEMDGDIFGGVGDYELNIGSDDDENEEDGAVEEDEAMEQDSTPIIPSIASTVEQPTAPRARRNWFGDEEEEQGSSYHVPEPTSDRPPRRLSRSRSLSPSDEEAADPSQPLQRLQPLSSSALPSAKDLLAADKAAEVAEKKQASKARWRAKQGLSKQDGGDDDDEEDRSRGLARQKEERKGEDKMRMNKEAQILESYMAKKEKGKSS